MLTIRKFLRTLIGTATPVQIAIACILGSLFGFLPITGGGWAAGALLATALLVLNANVFLAGIVAGVTKLLSLATAPLAFSLGHVLIDGPLQPIFRALVNAPITAWLGFDSYLAVGGLAIGLAVGIALGIFTSTLIRRVRGRLAGLESSSDAYRAMVSRRSVRLLAWIIFGGIPKKGFAETERRSGSPVRVSGIVASAVLIVSIGVVGWNLADGIARRVLVDQLTRLNGATVDVAELRIDWTGRIELRELAICDSDRLDRNLIEANRLVADLDVSDILSRRISIDLVEAVEVSNDLPRDTPGRRFETAANDPRPSDSESTDEEEIGDRLDLPSGNLDDYLRTAAAWRERLEQVDRFLRTVRELSPPTDANTSEDGRPASGDHDRSPRESTEEWLRRQVDLKGYAGVRATHLLEDHPTVLIHSIVAGGVRRGTSDVRRFDVYLENVSTAPRLVDRAPSLRIRETDDEIAFLIELGSISRRRGEDRFELLVRGLPTDEISRQLIGDERPPFSGGRINANMTGRLVLGPPIAIATPIEVELVDSLVRIGGEEATIPRLALRLDVGGALANPAIAVDEESLAKGLRDAGHAALAEKANSEIQKQLDDGLQRLEEEVGIEIPKDLRDGIGDALGGGLGDIFGGGGKKP